MQLEIVWFSYKNEFSFLDQNTDHKRENQQEKNVFANESIP